MRDVIRMVLIPLVILEAFREPDSLLEITGLGALLYALALVMLLLLFTGTILFCVNKLFLVIGLGFYAILIIPSSVILDHLLRIDSMGYKGIRSADTQKFLDNLGGES